MRFFGPLAIVSIRSRPEGREERAGCSTRRRRSTSFNPLPTRRPGGTGFPLAGRQAAELFQSAPDPKAGRNPTDTSAWCDECLVSIRSRPEGREELARPPAPRRGAAVSIRSRPEGREEPDERFAFSSRNAFQSAPDPKAGRNRARQAENDDAIGFNPLPTRRPGGTDLDADRVGAGEVSIRSRPEGREEPAAAEHSGTDNLFQSAPDPKAGRNVAASGHS